MSEGIKAADFDLPLATVNKIMKNVLPDNMQLTKEARSAIARACGIFVFYITHAANDFCREGKRQTIYPVDIINALKELGFEDFEQAVEECLIAYREEQRNKTSSSVAMETVEANDEIVVAEEEG